MKQVPKSVLASLLITSVLALPGGALAAPSVVAMEKPVQTMPAPAPAKDVAGEKLVEPVLTRDTAIVIAKKYFTIPKELGNPNVSINQSRERAIWSLEWQTPSKQANQTRISIGVDAVTGTIMSYGTYSYNQEQSLQLSFTRAEAKEKAQEWFAKLVPAEYQESLKFVESPLNAGYWGGTSYQFRWSRDVEGYPYAGNGVSITVDARSGEITQYGLNWQPVADLQLPREILSQADAEAAYRKQVPMELQYQRFTKRGTDEVEWKLVYRPLTGNFPSMNQEGVVLGWEGEPIELNTEFKLVPASDKEYIKPEKPLTQEQALAIARAITGQKGAPNHANYSEYGEETKRKAWDFSWVIEAEEGKHGSQQRVRVDAETGLVTELSHWTEIKPFAKDEEVPVSLEQAQEKAIAFIQAHRPDLAGNLQLHSAPNYYGKHDPDYKPTEHYISFRQMKNGVPVNGRDVSVSVNARTGEVRQFWSAWWEEQTDEEFPAAQPAISAEKAMDLFFEHQGIRAAWATFWKSETQTQSEPQLMWQAGSTLSIQSIDAHNGALMDWDGRDLIAAMQYPTDIAGHAAEREIELLWSRGVFDLQDGKFNPDQVVSADELARWIVLARGLRPYTAYAFDTMGRGGAAMEQAKASANSAYFGAALQSGIILPEDFEAIKDLNGPVTRELFALWAVRAMGYGRIAKMSAAIELSFADEAQVGAKYRNAVALLAGLEVVPGDAESNFRPQESLTRADAAKILFAVTSR